MSTLFPNPQLDETRFARVVVERGIDRVQGADDTGLTYAVGKLQVHVGQRVHVPLGRGSQPTAGIVVKLGGRELLDGLELSRVKPLLDVTPSSLPPKLIELANWASQYYVCPLGMVFASMLPAAVKRQIGKKQVVEVLYPSPREGQGVGSAGATRVNYTTPPRDREALARAQQLRKQLTGPEKQLWHRINARKLAGFQFRRQHPFGPYILDFFCDEAALAVELDGLSHVGDERIAHDRARTAYLKQHGVETLRLTNDHVLKNTSDALETIVAKLRERVARVAPNEPTPAPPSGRGLVLSKRLTKALELVTAADRALFPLTPKALAASVPGVTLPAIKKLIAAGALQTTTREEVTSHDDPLTKVTTAHKAPPPKLTDEQHAICSAITPTLGRFGVHLIRGVTGSGKTEIYMRLLEAALARDPQLSAIVLVPEIALTPQTAGRFLARFPRVAVLHSGLTSAQRHRQWAACAAGSIRVVVGARSAIFAPLPKLGLVIVDEEHDSSYKQDQLPRYHARDLGIKRAQLEDCPVILGSATPSLESWHNATQGKYTLHRLTKRVMDIPMPRVEIVDLKEERRLRAQGDGWRDRHVHLLGPTLESALGKTLGVGGQAILLLNRRGYANYLSCPDPKCGWVMRCDQCDAASVFHLHRDPHITQRGFVRCHHCLAELLLPKHCPVCHKNINTFGQGTQRVEEELERKFAASHDLAIERTLVRVDTDSMHNASDYFDVLSRFGRGEIKVLLGTQMIAKGLDYPNVQLVGVVNADTALVLPDFRAAERTFQLVSQVAGRAGRGDKPGRVIVQTFSPEEPSIKLAALHDFETFAREEMETRAHAGLPPIGRMARIVCRDEKLPKAEAAAKAIVHAIEEVDTAKQIRVTGPMPCPVSRIAGQHRIAIELLSNSRGVLQGTLASVRAQGLLKSDAHTAVDIDPVALM